MRYKGKNQIKALIAAGLLTLGLSSCSKPIQGYVNSYFALSDDYTSRPKLKIETKNCSVNNEYKRADKYIEIDWVERIDYSNCKKMWLTDEYLEENQFSDMPNLETLVLIDPDFLYLDEEVIKINSTSLKNLIIDGKMELDSIDHFDLTGCPNLEVLSLPPDSQETNLDGLRGLKNLKQFSFGIPYYMLDEAEIKILEDFQNRIDLVV